ncbi:MAG: hypothetical protein ACFFCH_09585, partial [Promethearchaeota archaeon]
NTGTKFAGRLASHADVQVIVENLVMQEEPLPEFRFRKLLPGQMFAQLTYAPESSREWGPGYQLVQIPYVTYQKCQREMWSVESRSWIQQKLRKAVLTTYGSLQDQRRPVPVLLPAEIERLLHKYIQKNKILHSCFLEV